MNPAMYEAIISVQVPRLSVLAASNVPIRTATRSVPSVRRMLEDNFREYYHLFPFLEDKWYDNSPHVCRIPSLFNLTMSPCECGCSRDLDRPCRCLCMPCIQLITRHIRGYRYVNLTSNYTLRELLNVERDRNNQINHGLRVFIVLEFDQSVQQYMY